MATRTKKAPPAKPVLQARFQDAEKPDEAEALAKFALRPSANAAVVIHEYGKTFGELDLGALVSNLADGVEAVNAGDLSKAEGMLYAQAQALQAMFMNFSRRALKQEYQKNLEAFFRMALKAQNQCRMTLETLANIKNPPVVIARQANINNGGQQQVNNGSGPADSANPAQAHAGAHAAKPQPDQTELLEASDGQRLDTRAPGTAGGADPHLATVGAVHRPAHR
ncbi:MAG: hypothetical protein KBC73_12405 [Burkholderiaceae bacterium]|nr:hypothetical protein [Burkholderiaceae bacterium]